MPSHRPGSKSPSLLALAAVVAALLGASAALWWPIGRSGTASDVQQTSDTETMGTSAMAADTPVASVPVASTTQVATAWPARPAARLAPGLRLAELLELKASLGATPDPGGEFTHTAELMLFADALQRLRQLQSDRSDAAELQGVARLMDEMLNALVQRRDLPLAQAHALKAELLLVLQPDLNTHQNLLVQWDLEQARALGTSAR